MAGIRTLQLLFAVASLSLVCGAGVTFTGDAIADFVTNISPEAQKTSTSATLAADSNSIVASGIDLLGLFAQYDIDTDTLFLGIKCNGICGDVDGDGNPDVDSNISDSIIDTYNWTANEQMTVMIWPEPGSWNPEGSSVFLPTLLFGIRENGGPELQVAVPPDNCTWTEYNLVPRPAACTNLAVLTSSASVAWDTSIPMSTVDPNFGLPIISQVPSASWPSLEITLPNFSKVPGSTFSLDGSDDIIFGLRVFSGTQGDGVAEDNPTALKITWSCPHPDRCGVCGGTNDCVDCNDVPFGTSSYDRCGICDGNNDCVDCNDVVDGTSSYDRCGVCDGNNACVDCFDVEFGTSTYDRCGVCDGNNACVDCFDVVDGTSSYDRCGVCDGNNDCVDCFDVEFGTSSYDRCGVCDGNNECVDCNDVVDGTSSYDRCGVCDGNNACVDCNDVVDGTSSYDRCGVCDGNNACVDCFDVVDGTSSYDRCGVCDGNNACVDCFDVEFGTSTYDRCGVCDGNNACVDCFDVVDGTSSYDRCGVCDGNNACVDCFDVPFGTSSYDRCGVCDGNNECVDCNDVVDGTSSYDNCGVCDGNNACIDCRGNAFGTLTYDICGVCGGNNESCVCAHYLGYDLEEVDYALLRWTVSASLVKIEDVLETLREIQRTLPSLEASSQMDLGMYIDQLHEFCDDCLDNFDLAQEWFAENLAGACDTISCEEIDLETFQWSK